MTRQPFPSRSGSYGVAFAFLGQAARLRGHDREERLALGQRPGGQVERHLGQPAGFQGWNRRRGVPYTKSDYALEPVGVQCETYGISMWLPYYAATWMWNEDAYTCRSNMAHVTGALLKLDDTTHGRQLPKRLDEWRTTVANFFGDFWPLTPYSLENNVWMAWQFDRPEMGAGVVQAFRRAENGDESATFRLRGLTPDAVYVLTNLDDPGTTEMTGSQLLDGGLPVVINEKPGAAIITYQKKSSVP